MRRKGEETNATSFMKGTWSEAAVGTLLTAVITAAANILLRKGLLARGGYHPKDLFDVIWQFLMFLTQPAFVLGFLAYFAAALLWMYVISDAPLSIVYPVLVGLSFLAVTIGSASAFKETIGGPTIIGACLILAGILIMSLQSSA